MARCLCLLLALLTIGCSKSPPPTPSPGTDLGETITGRERIGWDQPAADTTELATFRYAIYVDGVRSVVADAACGSTAGAGGFACSGRLPAIPAGTHTLELAAFFDTDGIVESGKSPPLRVTVTGLTSPDITAPLQPGEIITSVDGVRLTTTLLAGGLRDVVDFAIAADGRVLVAERAGRVRVVAPASPSAAGEDGAGTAAGDGEILALAMDPDFPRTGHVFVMHAPAGAFRIVRYRLARGALVDRTPLIRDCTGFRGTFSDAAHRTGPKALRGL